MCQCHTTVASLVGNSGPLNTRKTIEVRPNNGLSFKAKPVRRNGGDDLVVRRTDDNRTVSIKLHTAARRV